jgi:hypothetical protein
MQASTFNFSTQAQDQAQALTPAQYNALSDSWFGPAMPQADSPWDFSNQDQDQDQDQDLLASSTFESSSFDTDSEASAEESTSDDQVIAEAMIHQAGNNRLTLQEAIKQQAADEAYFKGLKITSDMMKAIDADIKALQSLQASFKGMKFDSILIKKLDVLLAAFMSNTAFTTLDLKEEALLKEIIAILGLPTLYSQKPSIEHLTCGQFNMQTIECIASLNCDDNDYFGLIGDFFRARTYQEDLSCSRGIAFIEPDLPQVAPEPQVAQQDLPQVAPEPQVAFIATPEPQVAQQDLPQVAEIDAVQDLPEDLDDDEIDGFQGADHEQNRLSFILSFFFLIFYVMFYMVSFASLFYFLSLMCTFDYKYVDSQLFAMERNSFGVPVSIMYKYYQGVY